jgi:hypothetical protein
MHFFMQRAIRIAALEYDILAGWPPVDLVE